jgi:hypothetical protein
VLNGTALEVLVVSFLPFLWFGLRVVHACPF